MRLARVFPRRTKASPTDELAFIGEVPLIRPEVDEVHVSATFSWDLGESERLAASWARYYPTRLGGPATGLSSGEFVPGRYLKPGYTITSRGCPNSCWFCSVWRREGNIRELPIVDGWNVLDDNILACSRDHFEAVCAMLKRQSRRAEFTGGLEAARLMGWHVNLLADLKPKQMFFALDSEDDFEPLAEAGRLCSPIWPLATSHVLRCYVLVGYPHDTFDAAEARLRFAVTCGMFPMAMLWHPDDGETDREWRRFQRSWAAPQAVGTRVAGTLDTDREE